MCQDPRVAEAMAAVGQPFSALFTEAALRRRQKSTELQNSDDEIETGSINQPRNNAMAFAKTKTVSIWKNPNVVPWKNPDDMSARRSMTDTAEKTISPEEERWLARMSPVY